MIPEKLSTIKFAPVQLMADVVKVFVPLALM